MNSFDEPLDCGGRTVDCHDSVVAGRNSQLFGRGFGGVGDGLLGWVSVDVVSWVVGLAHPLLTVADRLAVGVVCSGAG
jgi:hypothetical protein